MSLVTVALLAACVLCVGCVLKHNKDYEVFDLTFPFDNSTVYWPGAKEFVFTKQIDRDEITYWYRANEFAAGEHGGTHLDAPSHFNRTGKTVGEIPPEDLILSLIILDVSANVKDSPDYMLAEQDLSALAHVIISTIDQPTLILFKFGWSKFFYDKTTYLGQKEDGRLVFPGLSPKLVKWVATHRFVRGIGVDTASLDPGTSQAFFAHRASAAAEIYGLENVKLTQDIPATGCTAVVAPMFIAKGSGAPTRLLAMCRSRAAIAAEAAAATAEAAAAAAEAAAAAAEAIADAAEARS